MNHERGCGGPFCPVPVVFAVRMYGHARMHAYRRSTAEADTENNYNFIKKKFVFLQINRKDIPYECDDDTIVLAHSRL